MDSSERSGVDLYALSQGFKLLETFSQGDPQPVQSISPIALAYIGDAVFELYVRMQLLWPPQRIQQFHQQVVSQVKAEQQATYLEQLVPHLNEAEANLVRRGRNATSKPPRRLSAKVYRQATAFETLVGYLYITNQERLGELLNQLTISPQIQAAADGN